MTKQTRYWMTILGTAALAIGCSASAETREETTPKETSNITPWVDLAPEKDGVAETMDDAIDEAVSEGRAVSIVLGVEEVDQGELRKVYFGYDSETLDAKDMRELDLVRTWLEENPRENLVIEGHADERGSSAYNLALGERRAMAVRDYLVTMGVDDDRLRVVTYGEEDPLLEDADTRWEYRQNRRVEFESERDRTSASK